jgi:dihydrofolate reductase
MRNVIVSTYVTLDGRADDTREWAMAYDSAAAVEYHTELLKHSDGLLLGRRTYEIFAMLWPAKAGELPYVDTMNSMAKYVATTTLTSASWQNTQLLKGDVGQAVAELKRQPGQDLVVYGGHGLIAELRERRLVDEYRFLVHPVLFGNGRRLVDDGAPRQDLTLTDTTVLPGGVAVLTYRPAR